MYKVMKKFISSEGDNGQEYLAGAKIPKDELSEDYIAMLKKLNFVIDNNGEDETDAVDNALDEADEAKEAQERANLEAKEAQDKLDLEAKEAQDRADLEAKEAKEAYDALTTNQKKAFDKKQQENK